MSKPYTCMLQMYTFDAQCQLRVICLPYIACVGSSSIDFGTPNIQITSMPTLGPIIALEYVGRIPLGRNIYRIYISKIYCYQQGFLVLVTITSLNIIYRNFAGAYKIEIPFKMETLPLVWANCWFQCGHGITKK